MLILYNGKIRTSAAAPTPVSALAIRDGQVLAAGSDDQILALAGAGDVRHNLEGQTVWPGLTDAHLHLENYALSLNILDCELPTRQQVLQGVAERASSVPAGEWIRGHGWNHNVWPDGYGSAAELDAVAPNHPVYLTTKSLHGGWANSLALKLAGIDALTPNPPGGSILRDASGAATGILLESAVELVERVIPAPSLAQVSRWIAEKAQPALWKTGLTGVHDFDGVRCFQALQLLQEQGQLKLRVVKGIPVEMLPHAAALGLHSGFGSPLLRLGSVKCFSDGALGPQTAAMIAPYENSPEGRGQLLMSAEEVLETGRLAAQSGLPLAIHAIGDLANRTVLEGYALLRTYEKLNGLPALRHRIEHVQLLHPEDLPRLAELKIIASMQPIHATSDMHIADRYWGGRSSGAYAFRSLAESGAALAFGSDAPVELPNPFVGLHAAVTRRRADGSPGPQGWYPEQKLSLAQALAGFTSGAAYACGMEARLGRLEAGCLADLIVLPVDPFAIPAQEIYTIQPSATMVAGEWVWQGPGLGE